jgi:hypothetical protein
MMVEIGDRARAAGKQTLPLLILSGICVLHAACNRDTLRGSEAYFGQNLPGPQPALFAPGLISTALREYSSPQYLPGGDEILFAVADCDQHAILRVRKVAEMWISPKVAPFSGRYSDDSPVIDPDGTRLYFRSRRPLVPGGPPQLRYHSWVVARSGAEWGAPQRNAQFDDYVISSFAADGTIYCFSRSVPGVGGFDIFRAELVDGQYAAPTNLGEAVNSPYHDTSPCVSADESFLVFASRGRPDGAGLYVSFRRRDGSWTPAQNLGADINAAPQNNHPGLSPDGKFLFFTSWRFREQSYAEVPLTYSDIVRRLNGPQNIRDDIYWVDLAVVTELRPPDLDR